MGKQYLDENGNPIQQPTKVYLDDNGNPVKSQPASKPAPHDVKASPKTFSPEWWKEGAYNLADKVTNALPAAGGIAGGILGGTAGTVEPGAGNVLGATGGAALGGAAGESGRQLLRRAIFPNDASTPQTSLDAAKGIGIEAAKQGGSELAAGGLIRGLKAAAPHLAEAAVMPGKRLLKSSPEGTNIGRSLLDDTSSNNIKGVVDEYDNKIGADAAKKSAALQQSKAQGTHLPLDPPRRLIGAEHADAMQGNNPTYIGDVNKLKNQLDYEMGPDGKMQMATVAGPPTRAGARPMSPIRLQDSVDPVRFDKLRGGVDQAINSFDPSSATAIAPTQKMVRGTMSRMLHDAVPETVEPDANMTRMLPAREAAWNTLYHPSVMRGVVDRFARPTGALFSTGAGAGAGAAIAGPPGALVGGAAGAVLPEVLSSPSFLLRSARVLDSTAPQAVRGLRTAVPLGLSQMRDKDYTEDEEKQ